MWVTYDAGETWHDDTGDLRDATGTIGQVRPSAILLMPLSIGSAILVGTSNGVYVKRTGESSWQRFGSCSDLPQVLVAGLSYEAKSDVIVAVYFCV